MALAQAHPPTSVHLLPFIAFFQATFEKAFLDVVSNGILCVRKALEHRVVNASFDSLAIGLSGMDKGPIPSLVMISSLIFIQYQSSP